jgi:hypothetical protein
VPDFSENFRMPPGDITVCERELTIAIDSHAFDRPADRDLPYASAR